MTTFADIELLQDFLTEAVELLDDVDSKLVELKHRPEDHALLNDIFRSFHSIKGGAGLLEAQSIVQLCHRIENLFDRLRSGAAVLTPDLLNVVLTATREIHRMLKAMAAQKMPAPAPETLLNTLDASLCEEINFSAVSAIFPPSARPSTFNDAGDLDWLTLYQTLTASTVPHTATTVSDPSPRDEPGHTPTSQQAVSDSLHATRSHEPQEIPALSATANKESSIRVDTARFDHILNLSGEIGLTKNRLNTLFAELVRNHSNHNTTRSDPTHQALGLALAQMNTLVLDFQFAVMKARMQPVGRVFQKYGRLARDLARQLGKDIELRIVGADTEVDKTILEELNDPLVHMVRNACDHGIETPAERRAAGKPTHGTITLSTHQTGDHLVIEMADDGCGMSPETLRQKALEKKLITPDHANRLEPQQCLQLVFLPGFSTKNEITDCSGRGVGMDVVRTNILKLKGHIDIHTRLGEGSKITIYLPLTLAIFPVLVLRLGDQSFALPVSAVTEVVQIDQQTLAHISHQPMLMMHGKPVPLLGLSELLHRPHAPHANVGVVISINEKSFVLSADSCLGKHEVIVKPIEGMKPPGISGATLSSDGQLILVLEPREILQDYL